MQRELVVSDEVPSVCGSRECALIQFGPGPAVVAVEALVARADLDDGRTIQKVVCLDVAKLPRKAREALPVATIAATRLPDPRSNVLVDEVHAAAKGVGRAGRNRRKIERPAPAARRIEALVRCRDRDNPGSVAQAVGDDCAQGSAEAAQALPVAVVATLVAIRSGEMSRPTVRKRRFLLWKVVVCVDVASAVYLAPQHPRPPLRTWERLGRRFNPPGSASSNPATFLRKGCFAVRGANSYTRR